MAKINLNLNFNLASPENLVLYPNNTPYLITFLILITCELDSVRIKIVRIYKVITPGSERVKYQAIFISRLFIYKTDNSIIYYP